MSCIGVACRLPMCLFIILFVFIACCMFYCVVKLFVECICYLPRCYSCLLQRRSKGGGQGGQMHPAQPGKGRHNHIFLPIFSL